ncbi:LOG family protein [Sulfurovum sp. zt1-1]|uniref:AMP nucleosidase n=1 Tax=Sulfurovum zhangzhouensis TaxID=3019067 RepID=A0ABT7QXY7_9BACT|nr:LOG family protein [Sulfurovum zhangzhouensis]MDM5271690.1 LOG family protein [Sulfurovum zhangzhouensis]
MLRHSKANKANASFLYHDEARGVRLQLDYLKAEVAMREHHIEHTIVVFGSARIIEPEVAIQAHAEAEKNLEQAPDSPQLQVALKRATAMLKKSIHYEEARAFGRLVGASGKGPHDSRITLMTGAGPGIMEAANRGATDVGAKSIGLKIELPFEQTSNPYITPELNFVFHYFAIRKLHFMHRAKALVVFPGGFGTLDELFEVLTLIQTDTSEPMPVILIHREYWDRLINFEMLRDEEMISDTDYNLLSYAENAQEAWNSILKWYSDRGNPLC